MMKYLILYLLLINAVAIVLCISDKQRAKRKRPRISEKTLFTVSILGGSMSMFFAMLLLRHKTRHIRFMLGLPLVILVQFVLLVLFLHTSA